ncbi:MAG TPA: hypothetical protein VFI44_00815 [Ornithinibacter sp.]|nr:hypothetical protein [Ornithinibacter sp.]
MRAALTLGVLIALPGAWFVAQGEVLRWLGDGDPPRVLRPLAARVSDWRDRRRPPPTELPPVLITLELRRIEAEIRRVEASDAPHRAARLRAVVAAYDQLLLQLCESLGVETHVGLPPLPSGQRLALEAELVAAGHEW